MNKKNLVVLTKIRSPDALVHDGCWFDVGGGGSGV